MYEDSFGAFVDRCAVMYIFFFILFFSIRLAVQLVMWMIQGIVYIAKRVMIN